MINNSHLIAFSYSGVNYNFCMANIEKATITKAAFISDDKLYRYSLTRIWDESKTKLLFILFNPSTADSRKDDPTIRRLIGFAKSWGYGGIYVGNIYAYRSTDPKEIKKVLNPIGPENMRCLLELTSKVEKVVYAWGNHYQEPPWLRALVEQPYCISVSKKRIPKHPLYLRKD